MFSQFRVIDKQGVFYYSVYQTAYENVLIKEYPRAFPTEICPLNKTPRAPSSIICHIWSHTFPICRTAISPNTISRIIIEIIFSSLPLGLALDIAHHLSNYKERAGGTDKVLMSRLG